MQSMYGYMLETHHVCRVFCGKLHVMLFPVINVMHLYINTFPRMCAVVSMAVFFSPIISCLTAMLFRCFLNEVVEVVPVAPVVTGITLALTFHLRCTSIVRYLYFRLLLLLLLLLTGKLS